MAVPTLAVTNYALINACDATTDWDLAIGSGAGGGVNTDVVKQGTGSIARRIDNADKGFGYDLGAGNELDFSADGADVGKRIFFWVNILQPGFINTMRFRMSSSTSDPGLNWQDWTVFPDNPYEGGWYRAVVDPMAPGSAQAAGGMNESAIRWVAFMFDMQDVGGNLPNCYIDEIRIGTGLVITGGTGIDKFGWNEIADVDDTNAYGLVQRRSGVFFVVGDIQFGDGSGDCYFEDKDSVVVWESHVQGDGTDSYSATGYINADQVTALNDLSGYVINGISFDEGTGTIDFINGAKVGTGNDAAGIQGLQYIADAGLDNLVQMDFSGAITNIELYGTSFTNMLGDPFEAAAIIFSSDATDGPNHEVTSCTFALCGPVDAGRVSMQQNLFLSTRAAEGLITFDQVVSFRNIAGTYHDGTSEMSDPTIDNWTPLDTVAANTDDLIYAGSRNPFHGVHWASEQSFAAASANVWEYWNGIAWATLTVVGVTSTAPNKMQGVITWTEPTDWMRTTVNGGSDLYFVRIRWTAGLGGTLAMGWCLAHPVNGPALMWNANIDIVNSSFSSNADADAANKAHGIEHIVGGAVSYVGLTFTSNDADILFCAPGLVVDEYLFDNQDTDQILGDGTIAGVGQSITGDGTELTSLVVWLKKLGTPTGNLTVNLYAHSGTFGTSSVPTGAALATSETFDVSTLTTAYQQIELAFTDEFTLVNTTEYVIALEYSGGDGSNNVKVGTDVSSPTHGGNLSEDTGSWAAESGEDMCFKVLGDGNLTITASGGTDASTSTVCSGTLTIENLVTVTLTGLQANTEVRVYETGTIIEIDGVENSGTSFAFQADASAFVDIVIHHISYVPIFLENFDMPALDTSIPIQQEFDRVYLNP